MQTIASQVFAKPAAAVTQALQGHHQKLIFTEANYEYELPK